LSVGHDLSKVPVNKKP